MMPTISAASMPSRSMIKNGTSMIVMAEPPRARHARGATAAHVFLRSMWCSAAGPLYAKEPLKQHCACAKAYKALSLQLQEPLTQPSKS